MLRTDNCPSLANPRQEDGDYNGIGDLCQGGLDGDGDGHPDTLDNCPHQWNADQADADGDALGDASSTPSAWLPTGETRASH